jgi:hypothetical protein
LEQDNNKQKSLFREKALERISSPEKLTEYLRVTNPGIWAVLGVVILLLGGLLLWSAIGTLETTADAKIIVKSHTATVVLEEGGNITSDMTVKIQSNEYAIASTDTDEYGRTYGITEAQLPDGTYSGTVVVEVVRPIDFLLESK